jgi:hypothetical protein
MADDETQHYVDDKLVRENINFFCQNCQSLWLSINFGIHDDFRPARTFCILDNVTCPLCLFFFTALRSPAIEGPQQMEVTLEIARGPCNSAQLSPYLSCGAEDYSSGLHIIKLDDHRSATQHGDVFRFIDRNRIDFSRLGSWIKHCQQHHGRTCSRDSEEIECPVTKPASIRVIDCTERRIIQTTFLASFVALSYVWGTVAEAFEAEGIPGEDLHNTLPATLPNTIEDAITATIRLGYRYLWVDKYCIDQSNQDELQAQISIMDTIYHAASVTVIAAAGDDSHFGLPGVSDRSRIKQNKIVLYGNTWASAKDPLESVLESVWSTRAWYVKHFIRKWSTGRLRKLQDGDKLPRKSS